MRRRPSRYEKRAAKAKRVLYLLSQVARLEKELTHRRECYDGACGLMARLDWLHLLRATEQELSKTLHELNRLVGV